MDKKNKTKKNSKNNKKDTIKGTTFNGKKEKTYDEEYGFDFVPALNEWLNIDEQNENAERMENIENE